MADAPKFLITAHPLDFTVQVGNAAERRVTGNLGTNHGRGEFVLKVAGLFPELSRSDGLLALYAATGQLANGQPCAGSSVDEMKLVFRTMFMTLAGPAAKPTRAKRQKKLSLSSRLMMGLA